MFRTRLVFPIDGRAATMMRSPACKPRVISSTSTKPVGTPVMSRFCSKSCSIFGKLSLTRSRIAHEAGLQPVVGDGEDRALGLVQDQVGFLLGLVRVGDDLVRRVDQIAKRRLLFDDARVVLDVGRARHAVGKGGDVGGSANLVEFTGARQFLFQRDEVDRVVPLVERDHPIEDATMRVAVEVPAVDDLRCQIERVVVDQNRAEHRSFGFEIVRKRALRRGNSSIGHEERKICKRGVTKMVAGISDFWAVTEG